MSSPAHIDKTWSLIELVERFEAGAVLTTRQIARDYDVNVRTAQRWVNEIADRRGLCSSRPALGGVMQWRKG